MSFLPGTASLIKEIDSRFLRNSDRFNHTNLYFRLFNSKVHEFYCVIISLLVVYDVNNRLTDRRQSRRAVCVFLKSSCELLYLRFLLMI